MRHNPSVIVLRAISNASVLGMLSCIILALVYLTNAYGERGDRRNFRNICIYTVTHCIVILILSLIVHTWLFGYVMYEVVSIIDFILILKSARELNKVLTGRIAEAKLEFDKYNFRYRYRIQRRYKLVISGVILCLFIFVLGVFLHRIATIISVLKDYPCFFKQAYNIPIYLFLSKDQKTAVEIASNCFLVSFYVLILIFDILFVFLNISAILLHSFPKVLACQSCHSDKKIRSTLEPLLNKYHMSIRK
ncbi:hypothetical protein LOD99_11665 [Oopsacas minuta]|uniref:Uncharacterized protein n=1 Tax=Oopsacas minuta TaxID=111878 RepID=A0AAV7JLK6_9METZ|nr:hypothetical protein LOD99_11665 [Oopsacas minuta]